MRDAIHYPFSNIKKFIIIGLPYMIMVICYVLLRIQYDQLDSIMYLSDKAFVASPQFSNFIITLLLFCIIGLIAVIYLSGISISIIRDTINDNSELPDISLLENFVDGIKVCMIYLVYFGVPTILLVLIFLVAISLPVKIGEIIYIIALLLYLIIIMFLLLLQPSILSKYAQTGDVSKSLKIKEIYFISKNISFEKLFGIYIAIGIINSLLGIVGLFTGHIPVLNFIITGYFLYTFPYIVASRSYGLLYKNYLEYYEK